MSCRDLSTQNMASLEMKALYLSCRLLCSGNLLAHSLIVIAGFPAHARQLNIEVLRVTTDIGLSLVQSVACTHEKYNLTDIVPF
jgi:hypothetical protein